jgi:hypothetical protein
MTENTPPPGREFERLLEAVKGSRNEAAIVAYCC